MFLPLPLFLNSSKNKLDFFCLIAFKVTSSLTSSKGKTPLFFMPLNFATICLSLNEKIFTSPFSAV